MPEQFSEEKVKVMQALGAEVHRTPEDEGMQGAIRRAKALGASLPGSFVALQFENQANPEFHYQTTAPEVYEQMQERVDAIVVGIGTGGTFSGVARFLKERDPRVHCVAVESQGSILQGGEAGPRGCMVSSTSADHPPGTTRRVATFSISPPSSNFFSPIVVSDIL